MADKHLQQEQYGIMLPCPPEAFQDFISSLLGKAQTIQRLKYTAFEIARPDIENTYHLVDQRVSQQNESTLVQFTVRVIYNDGSSVLLNSFDDFQHYAEVRPLVSIGLHLTWTYLIKFQGKAFPENNRSSFTHTWVIPRIRFRFRNPRRDIKNVADTLVFALNTQRGRGEWILSHS